MSNPGDLTHRMSSLDASFLYLEQPHALLHVGALFTFARRLPLASLLTYLEERLPLVPRYSQRAVMVPLNLGHPTWEPDPEFDLHDHVIHHHLRGGSDDRALAQMCAKLFAAPLDRGRPLWEMHLIDGYGEGSALLAKTHHCMIDGASGVQLTNLLMDASPKPLARRAPSLPRPEALPNPVLHAADAVVDTLRSQFGLLRGAVQLLSRPQRAIEEARATLDAVSTLTRTLAESPRAMPFNGELSGERAIAWSRFSLNEVKAIRSRLGGTVNDVVLAVISGGLRHYLHQCGIKLDRSDLKAMVPVNLRSEHDPLRLGNRVSMMVTPLPVGTADPLERLRQVSTAMDLLKSSGESRQMERLVALTDLLPPVLQRPLARLQSSIAPVNTVCTNVPGPRETRYLLGEPVESMVPLVPLGANVGLVFGILSYADQMTIGINVDGLQVADAWSIDAALQRSYEELWQVTGLERITTAPQVKPALQRRASASKRQRA